MVACQNRSGKFAFCKISCSPVHCALGMLHVFEGQYSHDILCVPARPLVVVGMSISALIVCMLIEPTQCAALATVPSAGQDFSFPSCASATQTLCSSVLCLV